MFRPGEGPSGDVLVLVLLRGGMDGLFVVPPHADPLYRHARPSLTAPDPGRPDGVIDLDGRFGFHPALGALVEPFRAKQLAVVHACGGPDRTLSHFEASRALERGVPDADGAGTGWLARHLASRPEGRRSPVRVVAFTDTQPDVLGGVPGVALLRTLADVRLTHPPEWHGFETALGALYADGSDPVADAGRRTLELVRNLDRLAAAGADPLHGAEYPADKFGRDVREVARLVRAELGLEAAVLEISGWDSHADQARQLARPMDALGRGLAAFARDLGDRMRSVTVVALSEFGRRVGPNSGGGTDHGRGTAMFVLGGGVAGGKVYGRWPGLDATQLDGDGNLPVTTDYRSVLAEVLVGRLKSRSLGAVFPQFVPVPLGLFGG